MEDSRKVSLLICRSCDRFGVLRAVDELSKVLMRRLCYILILDNEDVVDF